MIEAIVKNPVKVLVGMILLTLFGTISLFNMPIQLIPEVQTPTLTVETRWPGASPQEVEREIVQEQEEQLQRVEGVTKMSSESMDSSGRVILEFAVGTDMNDALVRVNTRLSQVREYPEDADEPIISTSNVSDRPIAWFILNQTPPSHEAIAEYQRKFPQHQAALQSVIRASSPGLSMYRLRTLVESQPELEPLLPPTVDITGERTFVEDFIEARFERVPGVSTANVTGGREDELQVIIDPQKLAARQLTIMDVRAALRANEDISGGDYWEGKRRYVVRTLGESRTPEQVGGTVITRQSDGPVYVRDVATIRLGHKKPDGLMRRFGTSVIGINIVRETGSNILDVMEGLRAETVKLNAGILKQRGFTLNQVYDETEYIHSAIGLVQENLIEGAVLTFIALLVFLRSFRSSLVVFVSILVSMIGMFLLLGLMGRSINVPSLAGIAFATGMLVDNFIVVLENVYRHYQSGENPVTATVRGTREVWGAILSSTLANLAVFLPVLFVQEEAGQLFRDIALATSSALALSLLVSLTVVPMFASRVLPKREEPSESFEPTGNGNGLPAWNRVAGHLANGNGQHPWRAKFEAATERPRKRLSDLTDRILTPLDVLGSWFVHTVVSINTWLQQCLARQIAVAVGMFTASVLLSWMMMPRVEYLPTGNRNLVFGRLLPPPGYNLDQLTEMGRQIEQDLKPYWDVDIDSEEAKKLDYPAIADFFYVARGRELFMGMRAFDPLRAHELVGLIEKVTTGIPGTMGRANQSSLFERGLSGDRNVDVEIMGPDIEKLVALGSQVMREVPEKLKLPESMALWDGKPDLARSLPKPSLDLSAPEVHIIPKWEQAADMGILAADLGYTVDALVDGAYATDYFTGGDKIDLTILGTDKYTGRFQDLENLSIATPQGQLVPLSAVADIRFGSGPEQINRRERQRAITIQVGPPKQMPLEEAINRISDEIVQPMIDSGQLGTEYQIVFGGTADKLRSTWHSLRWNLLLALLITYLLMAALFESWLYPFIIILSVPLGAVGGFAGLWLLNFWVLQPLDVLTMLGFIILVGTVVNNPILIVEQALVHIREEDMEPHRAILESVRTRIRPIFMTAMIGLFGLLPLAISPGAGSELYRGIGVVLLGGLVVSTIFTLIFVPTVFNLAMHLKGWLRNMLGREPDAEALAAEHAAHPEPVALR